MRGVACLVAAAVAATAAAVGAAAPRRAAESPCKPQAAHSPDVGHLTKIIEGDVFRGKTLLTSDDAALKTNSTLCTTEDGQVKFVLERLKVTTCRMDPKGRIRLYPPKLAPGHRQVIIRFEEGSTWCGTGRDAEDELEKYDANKGRVRLLLRDPLFGVGVEGGDTVVKVALGYLEVSRLAGAGAVVVGAGQQVHVPDRGEPQAVEPISLSQTDVARFDELRSAVPTPSFDRPPANGSKTLSTLFERGVLTVGIDQSAAADRDTGVFIRRLFGFLALSWQMKVRFVDLLSLGVPAALDSGSVDIALTPDPSLPAELDFFATFADSTGTVWRTALRHDDVFALALLRFVRAAVGSGDYATFYRGSFGAEPQYEALAKTLLG